jgi:hypothetical protein
MTDQDRKAIARQIATQRLEIGMLKHILVKTGILTDDQLKFHRAAALDNLDTVQRAVEAELNQS